jgi:hypothetical protein
MRTSGVLFAAISIALLIPTYTYGQSSDPRAAEEQPEPYHKHRDTRQGHDHFYPDRGSILRDAPQGSIVVNYAGLSYRFHEGVWLEPRGPAFMVVAPPIGLIVPTLPTFATVLAHGGEIYLYCNEVYYLPRPDLSGYEVINDPAETAAKAKSDAALAGPVSVKPTAATRAAAPPPATAASTAEDDGEPAVVTPAAIPVARAVGVGAAPGVVSSPGSASSPASVNSPAPVSLPASALSPASMTSPTSVSSPASALSPASAISPASVSPSATVPVGMAMRSVPVPSTPPAVSTSSATPSNVALTSPPTGPATGPTTGPPASITVAAATPPGPASVTAAPISTPTAPPSVAPSTPPPAVPSATTPIAVPVAATAPVTLPTTSSSSATPDPPKGIRATLYPKNGQGADQLAHDRYDCYRFAVAQTGFDPVRSGGGASATASQQQYDYDRAQSACFEARGYTVR